MKKKHTWLFLLKILHNPPKIVVLSTKNSCQPASSPQKVFELKLGTLQVRWCFVLKIRHPQIFHTPSIDSAREFRGEFIRDRWPPRPLICHLANHLRPTLEASESDYSLRSSLASGRRVKWWWVGWLVETTASWRGDGDFDFEVPHWKCVSHEKPPENYFKIPLYWLVSRDPCNIYNGLIIPHKTT